MSRRMVEYANASAFAVEAMDEEVEVGEVLSVGVLPVFVAVVVVVLEVVDEFDLVPTIGGATDLREGAMSLY